MVKNRQCLACGHKYSYCPDCSRADKLAPSWKSQFCSEECMTLWTTLTKFGMDHMSKSEAKGIISKLNLKPIDAYVGCVQRDYAKVMTEDKKPRRAHKNTAPIIESVVEIEPVEVQPEVAADLYEVVLKEKE